jgi:hypothetical protein
VRLRVGIRKHLAGVAVPALLLLAGLAFPRVAAAGIHHRTLALQRPSCLCGADFNRDGRADQGSISSRAGAAFINLSLSGHDHPLSLRAGKGVVDVLAFDVDRDGDTDLVALKSNLRARVWLNNGRGEFVRRKQSASGVGSGGPAIAGHSQPSGACCSFENENDDGGVLAVSHIASAPQSAEVHDLRSVELSVEAPFLASLRPRGPPPTRS